ncbi:hypothetical protein BDZ45DRAFT_744365 [Acephala macrosclerotiorum]|nr:hypothetical protein BDZ45DRAFT_744365 [Acephala macrosclerotiorum]
MFVVRRPRSAQLLVDANGSEMHESLGMETGSAIGSTVWMELGGNGSWWIHLPGTTSSTTWSEVDCQLPYGAAVKLSLAGVCLTSPKTALKSSAEYQYVSKSIYGPPTRNSRGGKQLRDEERGNTKYNTHPPAVPPPYIRSCLLAAVARPARARAPGQ